MRIMGVDPSMTSTGISLPDGTTRTLKPLRAGDERLNEISDLVYAIGCSSVTDLVVMEDVPSRMIGAAGKVIPMLHGAIRYRLRERGIPYVALSPSTLKKFATGNGAADKTAMALAAYKRLGREYRTDDECDADWLRVAGRFAYGYEEHVTGRSLLPVYLPKDQLLALRWAGTGKARHEIVWPVVGGREPWPAVGLRSVITYDTEQPHAPGKAVLCGPCARLGHSICR